MDYPLVRSEGQHPATGGSDVSVHCQRLRVLVADDQPHVRAALAEVVSSDDNLELTGVAADAEEAIHLCGQLRPDVAVVDVKMPAGGGPAAAPA